MRYARLTRGDDRMPLQLPHIIHYVCSYILTHSIVASISAGL